MNYYNQIRTIEEKIFFNPVFYFKKTHKSPSENPIIDLKNKTFLIRNLVDDSYNLELGVYYTKTEKINIPYVAINNKYYFEGINKNPLLNTSDINLKQGFKYKVHRSLLENLSLTNTFVAAFGIDEKITENTSELIAHYILSPKFEYKPNYAKISDNEILLIKTIKKLELSLPNIKNPFDNTMFKHKPNLEIFYNHLYIVPEKISQLKSNETLFKIYMKNDDESEFYYDNNFSNGVLNSSFLKQKLTTNFIYNHSLITKNFGYGDARLVGEVKINESTSYDYKLKKIFEDYGPDSQQGIIAPYNYKGIYFQEVEMNLNALFKKFKIKWFGNIFQPILHPDEGKFMLEIKDINNHLTTNYTINFENIKIIRMRLKSQNPQITSLIGLSRMSEEAKNL